MAEKIEFKFDTQLLIAGEDLDEDEIFDHITENFEGDSLLAAVSYTHLKCPLTSPIKVQATIG